ncbi:MULTISPECIES: phage holin family protein [Olivibacter]|jgi:putative membrane protein|uniref:Phage holin family protein n=2 Tax=Sphingobacteriaceae TaxID=84566 RepID=F4C573_SPHS2|nr:MULTISPECIES: phage holin family protein [Olivibacter]MCL4639462.1 phage holin family protein [Olivibacter sp. UJ_SKK_5.1]MDM8176971.1 phage holin family protein [Olivibacter sp. 47]MDX3912467.1 phage holin family protein [Pseudosphingobacterium sp.]QEL00187.1 phage holin family protein [Olivibacter sp. LS-1]
MRFIIELIITGLAVMGAAYVVPGAEVSGFWSAMLAGILIALANATVGTILRFFTLPLNILTLGLISFIITVLMVMLVSSIMSGFSVSGFFSAMFFAILTAVIQMILSSLFGTNREN